MFCCSKKAKNKRKATTQAQDLVAQAGAAAAVAAEKIRPVATQLAAQGKDLAHQGKEWAAPRVEHAAERIRPVAAEAAARAAEVKDKTVNEYLPKAKRVARAAAQAAREAEARAMSDKADALAKYGEAATQQMVLDKAPEIARALAEPKPKKRRLRKLTGTLALIGGTVGAAYLLWKRSQPVEDPWAEAYWEDVTEETAAEPAPEDEDGSEAGRHKA